MKSISSAATLASTSSFGSTSPVDADAVLVEVLDSSFSGVGMKEDQRDPSLRDCICDFQSSSLSYVSSVDIHWHRRFRWGCRIAE
jgi:hypothetical protein